MTDMSNVTKTTKNDGIVHKLNLDGSNNPKYVDLLDEDKGVA